jgi:regulatory protein
MAIVTAMQPSRRGKERLRIYLDGTFAFTLHANVVARFRLQVGQDVSAQTRQDLETGQVRQDALDRALRLVTKRSQTTRDLREKLRRAEVPTAAVDHAVEQLERLGYLNDEAWAETRAREAVRRGHGRARARQELRQHGIGESDAAAAVALAYAEVDATQQAIEQARKRVNSLQRLEPDVARRRLAGFLMRRGFDHDATRAAVEAVLGDDA